MKLHSTFRLVPALIAGLMLTAPATGFSKDKIKVYRDDDGDGHYNKKEIKIDHNRHSRGNYHGGYRAPYYYRPSYNYGNSYYSRPYYYNEPRTSIGLSFSSRPSYSRSSPSYSDGLATDVQRALKRQGYYYGDIDGDIGPGTRSAIRAYQDDRGLDVTGRIDRTLLRSLGVG